VILVPIWRMSGKIGYLLKPRLGDRRVNVVPAKAGIHPSESECCFGTLQA
jgi:hypothetical protein